MDDPYALDTLFATSLVLENLFCINNKSTEPLTPYLLSDACFIVEDKPTLLPSEGTRRPLLRGIDTSRELLAFCRWVVNTSVVLKGEEMMKELSSFFSLLVSFFNTEWCRYTDRMRFQAEDSLYSQLAGMQDFLATFAALLVALEVYHMVSATSSNFLLSRMNFLSHFKQPHSPMDKHGYMNVLQTFCPRMLLGGGCGRFPCLFYKFAPILIFT